MSLWCSQNAEKEQKLFHNKTWSELIQLQGLKQAPKIQFRRQFFLFILAINKNKPIASTPEIFGSLVLLQLGFKVGDDFLLQFLNSKF